MSSIADLAVVIGWKAVRPSESGRISHNNFNDMHVRTFILSSLPPSPLNSPLMRPSLLDPLFAPLAAVSGVGPKIAPLFDRLLGRDGKPARVVDLVMHMPTGGIDRRLRPVLRDAPYGETVTLKVVVEAHRPPPPGRIKAPFRVLVSDETADMEIAFFNPRVGQIQSMLPVGATRWVSGTLELFDGLRQMVHPDRILDEQQLAAMPAVEPIYPLTEGLGARTVAKIARAALARLPAMPEWQDPAVLAKRQWPSFAEAMRAVHDPQDTAALVPESPVRQRLAYDELLANQLAIIMIRAQMKKASGRPTVGTGKLETPLRAALPFALTNGQETALGEIAKDMASQDRMLRLLQGDVGSGKTVVGLIAMARAVEAGKQAAMMAPTEILARQHFERMQPLATAAGIRIALLTGRDKAAERRETLEGLAAGFIDIVVGTHALFQEQVVFKDLALAVVDEQHRFGVHQRLALSAKGDGVDLLVMTATPIPRTLVLTYFGDMDVSVLREKPAGRKPIDTRAVALDRLEDVVAGIGRAIENGAQVYWVCPLVAESEMLDVSAAEDRFQHLKGLYGDRVDMVHGQMPGPEKDRAVERFASGETRLLVSTTVIEVGVDVPNASIMVIEHAERFGLAQLHQLRGRVGRGAQSSTCILLYKAPLGETAKSRIAIMRETEDGFRIAEEDLRLRGEGDVLGVKQSGAPGFRLADMAIHGDLLAMARDDAMLHHTRDPELTSARGQALRNLLYLFERDEAVKLLRAG
jgi:ATP-dependent DNA helicase RecG